LAAILFNWTLDTVARTTSSAAASLCSVNTELVAYLAGRKSYNKNNGPDYWVSQEPKFPLLAPLAQDLLCAPASRAYVERVFSVCGDLTSGKRNRLTKKLENRAFLTVKLDEPPVLCTSTAMNDFLAAAEKELERENGSFQVLCL